jgi:predicted MFS family arabinose efflux permease
VSIITSPQSPPTKSVAIVLAPVMSAVLAGFLIIGIALPVLPLHVQQDLGFGTFVVGLVAGSQFAASLFSRVWAGSFADTKGAKRAVVAGLVAAAASGFLYLLSLASIGSPTTSVTILLLGRALLGCAESFIITGGVSWGLARVEPRNAGKVIAWVGTAMFAALALGAPIGAMLYAVNGFAAIALVTMLLPLTVLVLPLRMAGIKPAMKRSSSTFRHVARAVWLPGLGAAFSSIGYGAILAFGSLLFTEHGWDPFWLPFSAFGIALILVRVLLGHLPDQRGGARIAFLFVLVEAAGLALIWLARGTLVATAGAALVGLGYSLVYPGFGVEAVRGVAPENRGLAMGLYTVFLDVALGVGSPALGLVADRAGLGAVFMVSAVVVLAGAGIALGLQHRRLPLSKPSF